MATNTFTDMPSTTSSPDSTRENAGQTAEDDHKVDISSADDVDVDKDIPPEEEDASSPPPASVKDGG